MRGTPGDDSYQSVRRFLLVAIIACFGALTVPAAANAWVDIDSPGEYTNDNTPLIKGDAEINFFIGIHSYLGCTSGGLDTGGFCIPYFFFHPTIGYTDVTANLLRKNGAQHWCPNTCATNIKDIDLGTPTPPIDDLTAYSEPYSWTAPQLSDGGWLLEVYHYGEDAPSPKVTRDFFVDTRAPQNTTITTAPPAFSNDTTPTFDWTATDPSPSSGLEFQCNLDDGGWDPCPANKTFDTPEGVHTLEVKAVDKAGNEDATPASFSWMVDTTPPVVTVTGLTPKQRFLLHAPINPTIDCTDPVSGGVRSGLKPTGVVSSSGAPECVANAINNEDLGPHEFNVTTEDRAGNGTVHRIAYVIDPPGYGDFVGADDPLAYYRLDEPVGSSGMMDRSGNGHDGIYQNGIALGRNGATSCERRPHPPRACELAHPAENKAGYFPPRDGHGYVNGITAPTGGYTMEAWVKPKDGADMMVMSHGGGGQLFIHGGNLAFRQVQDTIQSNGAVEPGKWTHVAATWDGGHTLLYVNGVEVAHSTTANKPPSGTSTFYVGYGEMAPWFHGDLDEVAYYDRALNQHAFEDRVKIGTAKDNPSIEAGNSPLNTEGPFTDPAAPKNGGLYAPGKVPVASFGCSDPDDLPGNSDIAVCTATVDGNPIVSGDPLPDSVGDHSFVVTAIDEGGNEYIHPHTYTVKSFSSIFGHDNPIAYYRLGDGSGSFMADASPNGHNGEYKNDQDSGPTGIAGDGDRARDFFGAGGYGYANGISAPRYQSTLEAWVKPLGDPDPSGAEFDGSTLPGNWSQQNVWNPGGSATVSGGQLIVDGASAGSNAVSGSGRTLDFKAAFAANTPYTHIGFGVDYNSPPWAMFSVKGDGELYARTDNGAGGTLETALGTGTLGSSHRYRIEWNANSVAYYVDGVVVASHAISFGATQMRPLASEFNSGGGDLRVDWVRMSPHSHRDQSIVGHGDAGEIYIRGGYFHFRHMDKTVTSSVPVKPGIWQQVVGTWDGVDIRIYVDGIEAGKVEQTKRPSSVSTFYVGYGELAPWFRGAIDEVAYYGIALPPARVYQHFLADPPPTGTADTGEPGDTTVGGKPEAEPDPGDITEAPPGSDEPISGPKGGESADPEPGIRPTGKSEVETASGKATAECLKATEKLKRLKTVRGKLGKRFGKATGKSKKALRKKIKRAGRQLYRQRRAVKSAC